MQGKSLLQRIIHLFIRLFIYFKTSFYLHRPTVSSAPARAGSRA